MLSGESRETLPHGNPNVTSGFCATMAAMAFSLRRKRPRPCSFNPGELSKGRGKVASVSYRLSSRRSSDTLRVMIEYSSLKKSAEQANKLVYG